KYFAALALAVVPLLRAPQPSVPAAAAALGLIAVLALTKFSYLIAGAGLAVLLLIHVAHTRGAGRALGLAAGAAAGVAVLWPEAGQVWENLPAFLGNSLELSGGYSAGMGLPGSPLDVAAAVVAIVLLVAAACVRPGNGLRPVSRACLVAAVAWLAFTHFK